MRRAGGGGPHDGQLRSPGRAGVANARHARDFPSDVSDVYGRRRALADLRHWYREHRRDAFEWFDAGAVGGDPRPEISISLVVRTREVD